MEMAVLVHGSDMRGSKCQHGSLDKIIKLRLLLIMISPKRMNYVESQIINHTGVTYVVFMRLSASQAQQKEACLS